MKFIFIVVLLIIVYWIIDYSHSQERRSMKQRILDLIGVTTAFVTGQLVQMFYN